MKKLKEELPMILVNVNKSVEGKKLFNVTHVAGMRITVESKRKPTTSTQCSRCQKYEHFQFRCTAAYKCLRCAENHSTYVCSYKEQNQKAKCANCGGPHHGASKTCAVHPDNIKKQKEEEKKQRLRGRRGEEECHTLK
ncbi:hypothetical protein Trydic_g16475 [Trypoxylus dichotomus]